MPVVTLRVAGQHDIDGQFVAFRQPPECEARAACGAQGGGDERNALAGCHQPQQHVMICRLDQPTRVELVAAKYVLAVVVIHRVAPPLEPENRLTCNGLQRQLPLAGQRV